MNSQIPPASEKRAAPPSFRGRSLSASLTVGDLEKSVAWYRDVLGFTIDRKHEREGKFIGVSFIAGNVRLLLTQDDGAHGERSKGEGFSLYITTAQDVDEVAARIKSRGGTLDLEPTDMHGTRAFRLRDPDGFKFTISSEP
jgi:catechol 2,3-dioxygenase-like lactoylglutathione lyase family enzyme